MVHGSERSSPIGGIYGYAMAAQGISVFVYDKRGTGGSDGEYTQNFELLAADAAKALDTARGMTAGPHCSPRVLRARPRGCGGPPPPHPSTRGLRLGPCCVLHTPITAEHP